MKAWLIDPFARSVTEVATDGTLDNLYALMVCDYIEAITPLDVDGDLLLLDENGKLCRQGPQAFFFCYCWPFDSLAGRALWIGRDGTEFGNPATALDDVRSQIGWLTV